MGPKIDTEKCEGCGNCLDVCPADVFELDGGTAAAVRPAECLDCGACSEECPSNAITVEE